MKKRWQQQHEKGRDDMNTQLLKGWAEIQACLRVSRDKARNLTNLGAPISVDKAQIPRADAQKLKDWFQENATRV